MGKKKEGKLSSRMLDGVERVGNALPSPATLFFILFLIVIILSFVFNKLGTKVTYDAIVDGKLEETTVLVKNLLSRDGLVHILTSAIGNFTGFFALGTVLTIMLGVGVADGSGLISALMRRVALNTPKALITSVVIFLGIMSNIASSTGYVVLVPLGAILFMAFGRHPIAGLAAAFAGVSGGWSANLLIGSNDPMFAGMATAAAQTLDPNYVVQPVANWYFMFASTFLLVIVGTFITDKIIEPRLPAYKPDVKEEADSVTADEKRGIKFAGIATLIYLIIVAVLVIPTNGLLRDPETGGILKSPFMNSIIIIMMLLFLIPGIAYGYGAKTLKSEKDIIKLMEKAISGLASFIVLIFFAAQFNGAFEYSNMGIVLSVKGANLLQNIGFIGLPLLIAFIILTAFINIFIAVDSAKWAMMAPIFVPMFMQLGISPEMTQLAYRIGDSSTNIIAPLMPFFVLTVAFFQKYDKKAGIGSVVSTMLPYSLGFLVSWIIMFIIWYLLGLPIGPGASIFY
ncbi:AbgT family transporter [Miniphocaeibacter halophilus]|uniref:AbgT family transporter n=1 Tax=Miniphocaeibacter halophilus TaxID=2931922 RepID=A0AC61MU03_9FIRM|nr:AbgT family transporter [Miniphocaeibacter halophilus]QQK06878.1 AbgT family transporter [Miniphocaeibacter halophilus]